MLAGNWLDLPTLDLTRKSQIFHIGLSIAPHGSKNATKDGNTIAKWFANGEIINIGICAGAESGLVILDVDQSHDGYKSLKKFKEISQTPKVQTDGGGMHY